MSDSTAAKRTHFHGTAVTKKLRYVLDFEDFYLYPKGDLLVLEVEGAPLVTFANIPSLADIIVQATEHITARGTILDQELRERGIII